jgi:hypothetical protein
MLLIATGVISLGGCASTITGTTAQMCESLPPIYPSRKDTRGTLDQVAGNNAAREAWCGRPPKPTKPNPVTS